MSYSLEEIAVIFVVLVTILILSLFFGLFWAVLLVFTLLWLLYNFGRENVRKKAVKTSTSHDIDFKQDDLIDGEMYSKGGIDVPFTGIPSPKVQSVRSPMPLLSVVTKRLSFNTSSFSPRENGRSTYRRSFGSPSPSVSQQSPSRHFSLINPKFQQQQPTIKIAPPPIERLVPVQEEAKESIQDPLSRSTILSALKQSTARKRSAYEEDEDTDFIIAQSANTNKRRRYNYPTYSENENLAVETKALDVTQDVIVNQTKTNNQSVSKQDVTEDNIINTPDVVRMPGIGALIQTRLKRRPLHSTDDGNEAKKALSKKKRQESNLQKTKEFVSQKTSSPQVKPTEKDHSAEPPSECTSKTSEESSKQLSGSKSKTIYMHNHDGDSDSGCDADDDDDIVMKSIPLQTERPAKRRGIDDDGSPVKSTGSPSNYKRAPTNTTPVGGRRVSKKQMMSHAITVTSSPARQSDSSDSTASQKNTPKKRFSILRFPSKNSEAKRRSVPVYCASVDSPDLHKRQPVSHKITKQDIEMDRKLAWKRIQSFLDTSDDDEDKKDNKNTVISPSVAINVVTCLAVSPPRSTSSTSPAKTKDGLVSGTLITSAVQSAGVPSTTGTSIPPLKLSSNTLQIKPVQAATTSSKSHAAATTAPSSTNTITLGITPIASTVDGSKTQTLVSSGITVRAPAISQSSNTSNPTTLSSFTLSSQSLQTPITSPALTSSSPQIQFGQKTLSTEKPLLTGPVSTSLQVNQKTTSQGLSSNLSLTGTFPNSNLVSRGLKVTNSTQAGSINVTTIHSQPTGGLGTNVPQLGSSNITNPLQVGSMSSNLLVSGTSALIGGPNAKSQPGLNISKPSGSSLFSGLTGNTSTPGVPLGITAANSVGPSASSSPFTFGTKTTDSNVASSQLAPKALTFSAAQTPTTNIFGSSSGSVSGSLSTLQQASKNSFSASLTSKGGISGSTFGQSSSAQQTAKENKPFPFVTQTAPQSTTTTNSLTAFGGKNTTTQSPFGVAPTQNAFGATTTQNAFGTTSTLGANTSQNTFGATPSQNAFGATTSQNPFGATKQIAFGTSSSQNTFRAGTNQSTFASPAAAASQNVFSSGNTANPAKSVFGSSASQGTFDKPAVGGFGSTSAPSTFGSQTASTGGFNFASNKPSATPNTAGFNFSSGASTGASSSSGGFSFGSSNSNSSAGGFSFGSGGAGSNSTPSSGGFNFGTGASKSTGGFNFASTSGNTPSNNTPGGFNFRNASSAKPAGGFAFGSPAPSGGFQFGAAQQNTPTPAPTFGSPAVQSTGFNFGGGPAPPAFGATTGTPGGFAFGASSQTPSSSVAKARIKSTTRRRTRK